MIHLQKHIKEALQKEFDKNTKDILFDVSLYSTKSNSYLTKKQDITNTYHVKDVRYTPVVIQDIFGEYVPVENSTVLQGNISLSLLALTDKADINDRLVEDDIESVLAALDEIRLNNQGKSIPIGNIAYGFGEVNINYASAQTSIIYLKGELLENGLIVEFKGDKTYRITKNNNQIILSTYEGINITQQNVVNISGNNVEILAYVTSTASESNSFLRVDSDIKDTSLVTKLSTDVGYLDNDYNENEGIKINGDSFKASELRLFSDKNDIFAENQNDTEISLTDVLANENKMEVIVEDFETGENLSQFTPTFEYTYTVDEIYSTMGDKGSMQLEFTVPNPSTNLVTFANGLNFQEFMISWGLTYSDNIFNGNDVKYFIDGVRVYPTHRGTGISNTQNAQQKINGKTSKSINEDNIITKTFTLHYDKGIKTSELVEHILSDELEQNKVWTLKEVYPTFSKEYEVIIIDGGMSPTMNTPLSYSIELALADSILN